MKPVSRRGFFKMAGAVVAGLAAGPLLSACNTGKEGIPVPLDEVPYPLNLKLSRSIDPNGKHMISVAEDVNPGDLYNWVVAKGYTVVDPDTCTSQILKDNFVRLQASGKIKPDPNNPDRWIIERGASVDVTKCFTESNEPAAQPAPQEATPKGMDIGEMQTQLAPESTTTPSPASDASENNSPPKLPDWESLTILGLSALGVIKFGPGAARLTIRLGKAMFSPEKAQLNRGIGWGRFSPENIGQTPLYKDRPRLAGGGPVLTPTEVKIKHALQEYYRNQEQAAIQIQAAMYTLDVAGNDPAATANKLRGPSYVGFAGQALPNMGRLQAGQNLEEIRRALNKLDMLKAKGYEVPTELVEHYRNIQEHLSSVAGQIPNPPGPQLPNPVADGIEAEIQIAQSALGRFLGKLGVLSAVTTAIKNIGERKRGPTGQVVEGKFREEE